MEDAKLTALHEDLSRSAETRGNRGGLGASKFSGGKRISTEARNATTLDDSGMVVQETIDRSKFPYVAFVKASAATAWKPSQPAESNDETESAEDEKPKSKSREGADGSKKRKSKEVSKEDVAEETKSESKSKRSKTSSDPAPEAKKVKTEAISVDAETDLVDALASVKQTAVLSISPLGLLLKKAKYLPLGGASESESARNCTLLGLCGRTSKDSLCAVLRFEDNRVETVRLIKAKATKEASVVVLKE